MSLRDIGLGLEVWLAIIGRGWPYFLAGTLTVIVVFAVVFIDWETILKDHTPTADHVEMPQDDEVYVVGDWGHPLEMLDGTEPEQVDDLGDSDE